MTSPAADADVIPENRPRSPQTLTEAQRRRAEANRAAALARRRAAAAGLVPGTRVVAPERVRRLDLRGPRDPSSRGRGAFVLLWVQSAQRARHNDALEFAAQRANALRLPLLAVFAGTGNYPGASERHLAFMYEGLCELRDALARDRSVPLLAFAGDPPAVIVEAAEHAAEVIVDGGYLRILREWRAAVAKRAGCPVWEVESEVAVPVFGPAPATTRAEPSAATLRGKILPRLETLVERGELLPTPLDPERAARGREHALRLLTRGGGEPGDEPGDEPGEPGEPTPSLRLRLRPGGGETRPPPARSFPFPELPLRLGPDACLDALDAAFDGRGVDRGVKRCAGYHVGGEAEAHRKLDVFLARRLGEYAARRNDVGAGLQSHLSPHVHYGQISVAHVARRALLLARSNPSLRRGVDVYVDELIVRRELAINFATHHPGTYDRFEGLPRWARETLAERSGDERAPRTYTRAEFERARTHDALWNAGQRELLVSGKQHNYVRMFWAKKILEWSADPREAWETATYLNNKYSLDGRDPASYTGVGWCFGLHDRPFPEAPVTGTIRRMSERGMRAKFDEGVRAYLRRWGEPAGAAGDGERTSRGESAERAAAPKPEPRQKRLEEMFAKRPRREGGA